MLNQSLLLTALLAGVAGGSHCIGMCGGIAAMLSNSPKPKDASIAGSKIIPIHAQEASTTKSQVWRNIGLLHAGRLLTYALAGALVGALGAAGLLLKPVIPVQSILFFIGNVSLIYLGFKCLGYVPNFVSLGRFGQIFSVRISGRFAAIFSNVRLSRSYFVRGIIWGCLPCGLVYGVLPLALVSGAAWSGAILMLCFGFGALPYLLFTQGLVQRFGAEKPPVWLAVGAALILIGLGLLGLFLPNEHHNAGWWC